MRKITTKNLSLISILFFIYSCSGGGGEEQPNISISWQAPTTREDGSQLKTSEIQGYVIAYIEKGELDYLREEYLIGLSKNKDFIDDPDISQYLPSYYIAELIETGLSNLIIIPNADETSYAFENLSAGTYYFAVSAYDYDSIYSRFSKTVETKVGD